MRTELIENADTPVLAPERDEALAQELDTARVAPGPGQVGALQCRQPVAAQRRAHASAGADPTHQVILFARQHSAPLDRLTSSMEDINEQARGQAVIRLVIRYVSTVVRPRVRFLPPLSTFGLGPGAAEPASESPASSGSMTCMASSSATTNRLNASPAARS
jgi:hypothetical protein